MSRVLDSVGCTSTNMLFCPVLPIIMIVPEKKKRTELRVEETHVPDHPVSLIPPSWTLPDRHCGMLDRLVECDKFGEAGGVKRIQMMEASCLDTETGLAPVPPLSVVPKDESIC